MKKAFLALALFLSPLASNAEGPYAGFNPTYPASGSGITVNSTAITGGTGPCAIWADASEILQCNSNLTFVPSGGVNTLSVGSVADDQQGVIDVIGDDDAIVPMEPTINLRGATASIAVYSAETGGTVKGYLTTSSTLLSTPQICDSTVCLGATTSLEMSAGASNEMILSATGLAISTTVSTTAAFRGGDGSATAATYAFTSAPNTGFYETGAGVRLVRGGTTVWTGSASSTIFGNTVYFPDGSAGFPSMSFNSDANVGFYRSGSDSFYAVANGVTQLRIEASVVSIYGAGGTAGVLQVNAGTAAAPALSWKSDNTTGLQFVGGLLGLSQGGVEMIGLATTGVTISTAVTVSGGRIISGGTAPAITSCGTSPSTVTGNNISGEFTWGTGDTDASCTLTFATDALYASNPQCFATNETTIVVLRTAATTTTLEIDAAVAATVGGDLVKYFCVE